MIPTLKGQITPLARSARPTGYRPNNVTSRPLIAWYNAADPATVEITGSGCSSWFDKSTTAAVSVQTDDAHRATYGTNVQNGRNGLVFAGDQWLNGPLVVGPATVIVVGTMTDPADCAFIEASPNSQVNKLWSIIKESGNITGRRANGGVEDATAAYTIGAAHMHTLATTTTSGTMAVDGTVLATNSNTIAQNTSATMCIGALFNSGATRQFKLIGNILEILIYDGGPLLTGEYAGLKQYLLKEWAF